MATLYPDIDKINSLRVPPTDGEVYLLEFLKHNLNDEYEIFFQPFLNGDCPDVILMRKGGGVLIIEVKDWDLSHYYIDYRKRWHVKNNSSLIKSPVDQVLQYKENIYDLHIENLLELKLRDFKHWYIVNCAIFFYKETQRQAEVFLMSFYDKQKDFLIQKNARQEAFRKLDEKRRSYQYFLKKSIDILGRDSLDNSTFSALLNRRWISRKSKYFTDDLYHSFKRHLKPPYHSADEGKNINYSKKQLQLCFSKTGEQKIRGIVGSGKTLVLAKRAVNAHKRSQDNVLILTYNISLKNYIHDKISQVREDFHWNVFHIANYHDFINSIFNNLGVTFDIPQDFNHWHNNDKSLFFENRYYGNASLFEKYNSSISKYATILIDEVQDYRTSWLRILKKYFLKEDGEFVVFGDDKQDIYNRVSLIGNKKELVIPDSPGRWAMLNQSFRLTPTITAFATSYQKEFLSSNHEVDVFEKVGIQSSFIDKVYYKDFDKSDYSSIADFIISFANRMNIHPNDSCVLSLSVELIREVDYVFRQLTHQKTYIMSETKEFYEHLKKNYSNKKDLKRELEKIRKNKKYNFWMNSGLTKFSTVHSFKGWEINTLFLIIEPGKFKDTYRELVYTGFTRCMENMVLINLGDSEIRNYIHKLKMVEVV